MQNLSHDINMLGALDTILNIKESFSFITFADTNFIPPKKIDF